MIPPKYWMSSVFLLTKNKTNMKSFLFAATVVCCFLFACSDAGSGNNENISKAKDIFKGIETGDTTKFTSIAPDAVDHAGPMGEMTGGDSIKATLANIHNHVRDLKIEIMGEAANGDYVYIWSRMSGTALDSTMGFPANQPFNVRGVDLVKFSNGLITEHWGFVDQQDLMTMRAMQMPNATTVNVTMGDTSAARKDSAARK